MAYLALYRQWRPKHFSDFVGQDAVITALKNQVISGRIGHAYLFCGSRGTGKTSAAQVFALAINCLDPKEGEACGVCQNCLRLSQETTMDIVEIDAASNNGVDEIRDLRDKVAYPPQDGKYRVYIIDEVHMLSTGAFNALLKTLEEPPAHAVFILATTEPQRLPPTILSRCQRYDFRRIPLPQLQQRLAEAAQRAGVNATPKALERIARAAEGGARDALSILDMCLSLAGEFLDEETVLDVLGASDRGFLLAFAQALIDRDAARAMSMIGDLMSLGREVSVFARDILQHLRQLMLAQTGGDALPELLEITGEDALRLVEQAQQVSRQRLLYMMDLYLTADTDLKWSSQPRIALELASARACLPPVEEGLEALLLRVEALEERLASGVVTAAPVPAQAATPAPSPVPAVASAPVEDAAPAARPPVESAAEPAPPQPSPGKEKSAAAVWKAFEDALKREEPALYSMVKQGRLLGREGEEYRLGFAPQGEVFLTTLTRPEKLELLQKALREAAGEGANLTLVKETAPAPDPLSPNATLQTAFDTFGREHVQVLRDEP